MTKEDPFERGIFGLNDDLLRISRVALLAAFADGELNQWELEEAHKTIKALARDYLFDCTEEQLDQTIEYAADWVRSAVHECMPTDIEQLAISKSADIADKDLRELTMIAALRIAYGDGSIESDEAHCIKALADQWQIQIRDLLL